MAKRWTQAEKDAVDIAAKESFSTGVLRQIWNLKYARSRPLCHRSKTTVFRVLKAARAKLLRENENGG